MKKKTKIIILLIVLAIVIGDAFLGIFIYGSFNGWLTRCAETEEILDIPENLKGATLILGKDEYVAIGKSSDYCSSILKNIGYQIVDTEIINNITIGKEYFESHGQTVSNLDKGKKFTLEKIVAETTHGFSAVDSGPGPIYYLILKDEQGSVYQIPTVRLGSDEKKSFLDYYINGLKMGSLTWTYFENIFEKD